MSISTLTDLLAGPRFDLLSTDVFDTVLLRDSTVESFRFARAAERAAQLLEVDPEVMVKLRWQTHDNAYRAVAIGRPDGEASLRAICATMASALGLGPEAGAIMERIEVDTDIEHLRPNRPLLAAFDQARRSGLRVIAVSDTYYGEADLWRMLEAVTGVRPVDAVYGSCDLGLTKHRGGIFAEVARREGVPPDRILHIGDSEGADVTMAEAAAWTALHLPRSRAYRSGKLVRSAMSLPLKLRRIR